MPTTPLPPSPRGPENLRALRSSAPTCGYAALADSVYRTCRCLEASLWPRQSHACTKHRTHIHIASELPNPKPTTSKTPSKVAPYFKFKIVRQNNKLGMKPRLPAKHASSHTLTAPSYTAKFGRQTSSERKKKHRRQSARHSVVRPPRTRWDWIASWPSITKTRSDDTWRLMTDLRPGTQKP